MGKFLLVSVVALVVWWLWRKSQAPVRDPVAPPLESPPELMVSCAHCGINQPRSECIERDNRFYCSEAHLRAAELQGAKDINGG